MLPTRKQALELLDWADSLNPGPWKNHSLHVARAAEAIAAAAGLDPARAFVLGALHDIGRYEGRTYMRHTIAGARLMREKGYDAIARVCLTHSFPDKDLSHYNGEWDVTDEDQNYIRTFVADADFDDYDRLIQLCDALALPSGICLMEKRLFDVALRYGPYPGLEKKWQAFIDIRRDFERRIGKSVYSLFPEAAENTFAMDV